MPDIEFRWGMFGENFTTAGLLESEVNIGDKFRIGSAIVMATEPRMPCYKLGIRFGRAEIVKRFMASERTGFYFAVLQEGKVGVGDLIELIEKSKDSLGVSDITRSILMKSTTPNCSGAQSRSQPLPESWKSYFQHRLAKLTGSSSD